MNFDFSDDQRLLQHEVHRMLAATSTSAEVRQTLEGHTLYSEASWQGLLQMGAATAVVAFWACPLIGLKRLLAEGSSRAMQMACLSSRIRSQNNLRLPP